MKLIAHIVVRFAIPITVCVALMVSISLGVISGKVNDWSASVETHMLAEERQNLLQRTRKIASAVQTDFQHTLNDIMLAKDYAEGVLNGSIPTAGQYGHYNAITGPTPPTAGGMKYSSWYNRANSNTATETLLIPTSSFDNVFRPISKSTTKYDFLYFGAENGFYRSYPFSYKPIYPTMNYFCEKTQALTTGYDPTCRIWYTTAKGNSSKVILTNPYVDASSGNVLITAAKGIITSGTFRGVLGYDLSIQNIETLILGATLLTNGYTFLMTKTSEVVIHPNVPRVRTAPISVLQSENMGDAEYTTFLQDLVPGMFAQGSGQFNFFSHMGQEWVASYSLIEGTDYVLLGVVPLTDITRATDELRESSSKTIRDSVIALIVIGVFLLIGSLYINIRISSGITEPLRELQEASNQVAEGQLGVAVENIDVNCEELENIRGSFAVLVKAVRTANEHYMMSNPRAAEQSYRELERHLAEHNLQWGLSTVYNNLALSLELQAMKCSDPRKTELVTEARGHLEHSIVIAESFLSQSHQPTATSEDSSNSGPSVEMESKLPIPYHLIRIRIADRYRNLGDLLSKDENTIPDALRALNTSVTLHKQAENALGEIHAIGSLGMLSQESFAALAALYNDAVSRYIEACSIYRERSSGDAPPEKVEDKLREVELASFYYARALQHYKDDKGAVQCCNYLLKLRDQIPEGLLFNVLNILVNCHQNLGNTDTATGIHKKLAEYRKAAPAAPKSMIFVLDVSGSMSGSRITTCRQSIKKIIQEYSTPKDMAALITFSSEVKMPQDFMQLDEYGVQIFQGRIERDTTPGGRTAFYDALVVALRMQGGKHGSSYIIALTDGADNCSRNSCSDVAQMFRQDNGQKKLFVITVGQLSTKDDIQLIVHASGGKHIEAMQIEDISAAFETVATEMVSLGGIEA